MVNNYSDELYGKDRKYLKDEIVSVDDFCFEERTSDSEVGRIERLKGKKDNVMIRNTRVKIVITNQVGDLWE